MELRFAEQVSVLQTRLRWQSGSLPRDELRPEPRAAAPTLAQLDLLLLGMHKGRIVQYTSRSFAILVPNWT